MEVPAPSEIYLPYLENSLIPGLKPAEAVRVISDESEVWFNQHGKRTQPWTISAGRVILYLGTKMEEDITDKLYEEAPRLSDETLHAIRIYEGTENGLWYFSNEQQKVTFPFMGFQRAAYQWAPEEDLHGAGLRKIREASGKFSLTQINDDYHQRLYVPWNTPYPGDVRKMDCYGLGQEKHTQPDYFMLEGRARDENAPTVADLLHTIGSDEGFHAYIYSGFFSIFYKHDPEGSVKDLLDVSAMLRLPEHGLMTDYAEDTTMFQHMGFGPLRSVRIIEDMLRKTKVVSEEQIRATRRNYLDGIRQEARARKEQLHQLELGLT